jgi:hypothetical protein
VFAWIVGRAVFGDGHPAIDFLLLLAVVSDCLGVLFIALFYTGESSPIRPIWLLLVLGAVGWCAALRMWHFRDDPHPPAHQAWQPYIFIGGTLSWIGFINARLHPALALVPIVPWMPGPYKEQLETLDNEVEEVLENEATDGKADDMIRIFRSTREEAGQLFASDDLDDVDDFDEHNDHDDDHDDRRNDGADSEINAGDLTGGGRLRQRRHSSSSSSSSSSLNGEEEDARSAGQVRKRRVASNISSKAMLLHTPANVQMIEELNLNAIVTEHHDHP